MEFNDYYQYKLCVWVWVFLSTVRARTHTHCELPAIKWSDAVRLGASAERTLVVDDDGCMECVCVRAETFAVPCASL